MSLTAYESKRLRAIEHWKTTKPDWGTRLMSGPGRVAAAAARTLVPVSLLRRTLGGLDRLAGRLSGADDVLRAAGVESLDALAHGTLETCDRTAARVARRAMLIGGSSGAVLGVGGAVGMVIDVPTLLALALRTIHRTAYAYGEDWTGEDARSLSIGVFALASANSMEEKQAALAALAGEHALLDAAWRDGIERVAERELAKEATQFSLQTLAGRIGVHIGTRKAKGMLPLVGSVIGAAVNANYLSDVARVARFVAQERWLRRRHPKLLAAKELLHVAPLRTRTDAGAESSSN